MKLIDILVEELPKRGGWPEGANCITQDSDLRVEPATCYPSVAKYRDTGFWFRDSSRIGGFGVDTLASDYTTAIITREQYEAALAAKNGGWIEWGGGECPVEKGTLIDVKWRDGRIDDSIQAKVSHGPESPNKRNAIGWRHFGIAHDIIAYRLHQPQEALQDKADLNEFARQDSAPVWNGEGLPPVGMKVEWLSDKYGWLGGTVAAHDAKYPLIAIIRHNDGYTGCHRHEIRTEAERKREAARNGIYAAMDIVDGDIADAIYDAIAAGKIPGVKLED